MFPEEKNYVTINPAPKSPTVEEVRSRKRTLEITLTNAVRDFEKVTGLEVINVYVPMFAKKDGLTVTAKLP
jgi:hypothetical protein